MLCLCLTGGAQFSTISCSGQPFFACSSPSLPCKAHEVYCLLQHVLGPQGACTAHRRALEEAMKRAISQINVVKLLLLCPNAQGHAHYMPMVLGTINTSS